MKKRVTLKATKRATLNKLKKIQRAEKFSLSSLSVRKPSCYRQLFPQLLSKYWCKEIQILNIICFTLQCLIWLIYTRILILCVSLFFPSFTLKISHIIAHHSFYLDSLYPEAQGVSGAHGLPPLHVTRLCDPPLGMLMRSWPLAVYLHHFVIEVFSRLGPFPRSHKLLLQVGPSTRMEQRIFRCWI